MSTRELRPMALTLLVLHVSGCMTWQPSPLSPRRLIQEEEPHKVRVTLPDSTPLVVRNPLIEDDSIAVVSGQCRRLPGRTVRYSCPTRALVALDDVAAIEVERRARGRTLLLFAPLLIFGTLAVAYYASCSETTIPGC